MGEGGAHAAGGQTLQHFGRPQSAALIGPPVCPSPSGTPPDSAATSLLVKSEPSTTFGQPHGPGLSPRFASTPAPAGSPLNAPLRRDPLILAWALQAPPAPAMALQLQFRHDCQ